MPTLVLAIVILLLLFIVLGVDAKNKTFKVRPRQLLSLLALLLLVPNLFAFIPANNVGILYSPFSGVSESTLPEGFHTKGLFDTVYNINTEVQTRELIGVTGQTQDAQYITMTIDVKYRVDKSKAFEVFRQFRTMDSVSNNLIGPVVQRSIEAISTQYNVMDVLGEKRNELYLGIENELQERLKASGIDFVSINFTDTDAGDAIEQAIQDEAIAKKRVETAEQERLRVEIESQQRVVEARANQDKAKIEAETQVIQAEAAAKIKAIEAKAEADANKTVSGSITPQLLEKMEMEARLRHGWVTIMGSSTVVVPEPTPAIAPEPVYDYAE